MPEGLDNKNLDLRDKGLKGSIDSFTFDPNLSANISETYSKLPLMSGTSSVYTFSDSKNYYEDGLISPDVSPEEAEMFGGIDELAARNQSMGRLIGHSLGQIATELTLGTLEGIGYLAEIDQLFDSQKRAEEGFSNAWVDFFGDLKQDINDSTFVIHKTKAGQGFAPGDATWWASNAATIGTALSLMIPAMGVGKLASLTGKALKLTKGIAKGVSIFDKVSDMASVEAKVGKFLDVEDKVSKFLEASSSAVFSRYTENFMEAKQKFDESLEYYNAKGLNEPEARELAAREAASVWKSNSAMLALDFLQYSGLTKAFGSASKSASLAEELLGKRGAAVLNFTGQMASEAAEEGYQFVAGKEAEAKVRRGKTPFFDGEFGQRMGDYINDPEMQTSMFWGAAGGGIFGGLGPAVSKTYDKILRQKAYYDSKKIAAGYLNDVNDYLKTSNNEFLTVLQAKYNTAKGKNQNITDAMTNFAKELIDFNDVNSANLDDATKKELKERIEKEAKLINEFGSKFKELDKSPLFRANDNLKAKYLSSVFQLRFTEEHINNRSNAINKLLSDNNVSSELKAIKALQNRLRVSEELLKKIKKGTYKTSLSEEALTALKKELEDHISTTKEVFESTLAAHKEANPEFTTDTIIDKELEVEYNALIEDEIQRDFVLKPYINALNKLSEDQIKAENKANEDAKRNANTKHAEEATSTVTDETSKVEFDKKTEEAGVSEEGGSFLQQQAQKEIDELKQTNSQTTIVSPQDEFNGADSGSFLQQEADKANALSNRAPLSPIIDSKPKGFMELRKALSSIAVSNIPYIQDILNVLVKKMKSNTFNDTFSKLVDAYEAEQNPEIKEHIAELITNINTVINNMTTTTNVVSSHDVSDKESIIKEEEVVETATDIEAKKADIEKGRVGNTSYEVKSDGVYWQGKKLDNPENKPYSKLIIADIKRRWQEELSSVKNKGGKIVGYADAIINGKFHKITSSPNEDTVFEITKDDNGGHSFGVYSGAERRVLKNPDFLDGTKKQKVGDSKNYLSVERGVLSVDGNDFVINKTANIILSSEPILDTREAKINAKYEAELTALESRAIQKTESVSQTITKEELVSQEAITPASDEVVFDPKSLHLNDATNALHSKIREFAIEYNTEEGVWQVVKDTNGNPMRMQVKDPTLQIDYEALDSGKIEPNDEIFYTINSTSDYTKDKFFHKYSIQIVINVRKSDGTTHVVGVLDAPYDSKLNGKYGYDMSNPTTKETVLNNRLLRDDIWQYLTDNNLIADNRLIVGGIITLPNQFNSSVKEVLPGKLNTVARDVDTSEFKGTTSDMIFGYSKDTFGNIEVPKGIDIAPHSNKTDVGHRYLLFKHPNKNVRIPLNVKLKKMRQLTNELRTTILTNAFREANKHTTPNDIYNTINQYFRLPQSGKKKMYVSRAKSDIPGIAKVGDMLLSFSGDAYSLALPPINITSLAANNFDISTIDPKTLSYIGSETYPYLDHTKLNSRTSNTPISIDDSILYNDYVMQVTTININPIRPIILTNIEVNKYNPNPSSNVAPPVKKSSKVASTTVKKAEAEATVVSDTIDTKVEPKPVVNETEEPSLDDILNDDIDGDNNYDGNIIDSTSTENLPKTSTTESTIKWDEERELTWFKKRFPNIPISVLNDLKEIASKGGSNSMAVFRNAAVYIYKHASLGVAYHEAFHIVFDLMLSDAIKLDLYRDARNKYKVSANDINNIVNRYKKEFNINLTEAQAERIVLEEHMADDFANYVISEGEPLTIKNLPSKIAAIFRRLYQMIKSFVTNEITIDNVFYDIQKGKYNTSSLTAEQLNKFSNNLPKNKLWSTRKTNRIVSNINHRLISSVIPYIKNSDPERFSSMEDEDVLIALIKELGINKVYSYVYKDIRATLAANKDNMSADEIKATVDILNNIYNVKTQTYGELIPELVRGLSYYGIIVNNKRIIKPSESISVTEEEATTTENWQLDVNKKSTKDNVTFKIKKYLRGLVNNTNGSDIRKDTGVFSTEFVDYDIAFNTLMGTLSDSININDMLLKLKEMSSTYPYANQIYNDAVSDKNLQNSLWATFSNPTRNRLYISQVNKTVNVGGIASTVNQFIIGEANRKNINSIIINNWYNGILDAGKLVNETNINNTFIENINKEYAKTFRTNVITALRNKNFTLASSLMNEAGINMSKESLESIDKDKKLVRFIGKLNPILAVFENGFNPFNKEDGNFKGKQLKDLAAYVKNTVPEIREQSYVNVNGDKVYGNIKPNFINTIVRKIKRIPKETLNYYLDPTVGDVLYIHGAIWMNELYQEVLDWEQNGRVGALDNLDLFEYYELDGLTLTNEAGESYDEFNHKSLKISNMALFSNNSNRTEAYYRMLSGDASTSGIIKYKKLNRDEVITNLTKLAFGEYKRILNIQKRLSDKSIEKIENYDTEANASFKSGFKFLQVFNTLNETDVKFHFENIKEQASKDWIKSQIINYLNTKLEEYKESLRNEGVLYKDKNGNERLIADERSITSSRSIDNFLSDFYYNSFFANTQIALLTSGDPAFYKKNKNSDSTSIDYQKRAKQTISPKSAPNTDAVWVDKNGIEHPIRKKRYRSLTFKDKDLKSSDTLVKTLEEGYRASGMSESEIKFRLSKFKKNNVTDAQTYISLDFYKDTMISNDRWNQELEDAYQALKEERGTLKDIRIIMQPIKPFKYGHEKQTVNGSSNVVVPEQHKNSEIILIPQFIKKGSPEIQAFYNAMVEGNIDSVLFDSAVKVGGKNIQSNYSKVNINKYSEHNMEDRGIQQDTPEHHMDASNLFGTQIRKLIFANINENIDYIVNLDGSTTPISFKGKQLVDFYQKVITENLIEKAEYIDSKFKDINALKDFLLEESAKNGDVSDLEKALELEEVNGELRFKLPLFFPTYGRKIESLIISIYKNNIVKQKIKGGAFIQASAFGFEDQLEVVTENGAIKYMQCKIPYPSDDIAAKYVNPDGSISDKLIEDHPELFDGIGYRIPTEGKYSMIPIKVVGFTPREMGGIILLPPEITTISGSDFDVDKMYVMLPEYTIDRKGNYKVIPFYTIPSEEAYNQYITDRASKDSKDYVNFLSKAESKRLLSLAKNNFDNFVSHFDINYKTEFKALRDALNNGDIQTYIEELNIAKKGLLGQLSDSSYDSFTELKTQLDNNGVKGIKRVVEYKELADNLLANSNLDKDDINILNNIQAIHNEELRMYGVKTETINNFNTEFNNAKRNELNRLTAHQKELFNNFKHEISIQLAELNKLETYDEFVTNFESNIPKYNSRLARNNALIAIMRSILTNQNTIGEYKPGGYDKLKSYAVDTIESIYPNTISYDDLMLPQVMDNFTIDNLVAKKLIGVAAVHNSLKPLLVRSNLQLNNGLQYGDRLLTSFASEKTIDNNELISDNLAEFLAAVVDSTKDPVVNKINYNLYTANMISTLLQLGIPLRTALNFFNSQVIRDLGRKALYDIKAVNEELFNISMMPNFKDIPTFDFEIANDIKELNKIESIVLLKAFINIKGISDEVSSVSRMVGADRTNTLGPTMADNLEVISNLPEIKDYNYLANVNSVLENNEAFAAFVNLALIGSTNKLNEYIPYNSPLFSIVRQLIGDNMLPSTRLTKKNINYINQQLLSYLYSDFSLFRMTKDEKVNLLSNLPSEISSLSNKYPELVGRNKFISYLSKEKIKFNNKSISLIVGDNSSTISQEQTRDIKDSFLDLLESEEREIRDLALNIMKYSFITSGFTYSNTSIYTLIPAEAYINGLRNIDNELNINDFSYSINDTVNNSDVETTMRFVDQFLRNNYNNESYVPSLNANDITKGTAKLNNIVDKIPTIINNVSKSLTTTGKNMPLYITYEVDDVKYLYKQDSVSDKTYIRVNQLGFGQYMHEYDMNNDIDNSIVGVNNIVKKDVITEPKEQPITKSIQDSRTEDVLQDSGSVLQALVAEEAPNSIEPTVKDSTKITKEGNDVIYGIFRIKNGDFNTVVNNTNGKPVSLGSKLIERITEELKKFTENNC